MLSASTVDRTGANCWSWRSHQTLEKHSRCQSWWCPTARCWACCWQCHWWTLWWICSQWILLNYFFLMNSCWNTFSWWIEPLLLKASTRKLLFYELDELLENRSCWWACCRWTLLTLLVANCFVANRSFLISLMNNFFCQWTLCRWIGYHELVVRCLSSMSSMNCFDWNCPCFIATEVVVHWCCASLLLLSILSLSPPSLERGVNSEMTRWGVVGHKLLEVDDDENSKVIVEPLSLVELVVDDRSCAIVEGDLQKQLLWV